MKWFKDLYLVLFAFLVPIQSLLLFTGILIFIDLIFGVWAAKIRNEHLTSRAFRATISKTCAYQLAIVTAQILQTNFIPLIPVVKILSSTIGLAEAKSIFENLHTITGIDIMEKLKNVTKSPKPKLGKSKRKNK